jgi:hypothetical protein
MYNVLHTASAPGPADAFRSRGGRARERLRRLGRTGSLPVSAAEPAESGRLVALTSAVVREGLDGCSTAPWGVEPLLAHRAVGPPRCGALRVEVKEAPASVNQCLDPGRS